MIEELLIGLFSLGGLRRLVTFCSAVIAMSSDEKPATASVMAYWSSPVFAML